MAKLTKANIITLIKDNSADAKISANLKAELDFLFEEFSENPRNVTTEDLQVAVKSLAKEGVKIPELMVAKKDAETSTKAKAPKKVKEEVVKEEIKEAPKSNPKPKTGSKKYQLKRVEFLAEFPEELKVNDEIGEMKLRNDIVTLGQLSKEVEEGKNLYITTYWNKRSLRQFNYDAFLINEEEFTEFPMDLDLSQILYCSDKVCYATSLYSEVLTTFVTDGFEPDEDKIRYTDGTAFQIYEVL